MSPTILQARAAGVGPSRSATRLFVALGLIAVVLAGLSAAEARADTRNVQAHGRWRCAGTPLAGARVRLYLLRSSFDRLLATGVTDANGEYSLEGTYESGPQANADPRVFAQVQLDSTAGGPSGVVVESAILGMSTRADTPRIAPAAGVTEIGSYSFLDSDGGSLGCQLYQAASGIRAEYVAATGVDPPVKVVRILYPDALTGDAPWTTSDAIHWPVGPGPAGTAGLVGAVRHEFGLLVRHAFDGDFTHFLTDVVRYDYTRHHRHCTVANDGFAFDQGWAEWYSGDTAACHPSRLRTNTEGDVAAAINSLESACGRTRAEMIIALQGHQRQVHSFGEYKKLFGTCVQLATPPARPATPPPT